MIDLLSGFKADLKVTLDVDRIECYVLPKLLIG